MPDEFPTLEVVAAVGVVALFIRTLIIGSEMRGLPSFTDELTGSLERGQRAAAFRACSTASAPALARSARELITLAGDPPYGRELSLELTHELDELELGLARRAESGRARDLIVLSVLLGAMAFAVLSKLPVSPWFHWLATAAALLLIVGYVMRVRLRRVERRELGRIGDALIRMASAVDEMRPRQSSNSIDGGCTSCGETLFLIARDAALGASLPALGIHELRICKNCGHVVGQAEDSVVLGQAALQELSVALDPDGEASSDDTEHDG